MNVNLASLKLVLNVKYLLLSFLFHNLGHIEGTINGALTQKIFSDLYYFSDLIFMLAEKIRTNIQY